MNQENFSQDVLMKDLLHFFFINKGIVYDIYNTYLLSNAIRSRLFKVTGKND